MNAKQSKRLRKAALRIAAMAEQNGNQISKEGYLVKTHPKMIQKMIENEDGAQVPATERVDKLQVIVKPQTYKGIYKALKKA